MSPCGSVLVQPSDPALTGEYSLLIMNACSGATGRERSAIAIEHVVYNGELVSVVWWIDFTHGSVGIVPPVSLQKRFLATRQHMQRCAIRHIRRSEPVGRSRIQGNGA